MNYYIYLILVGSLCFTACDSGNVPAGDNPSASQIEKLLENYYTTMSDRNWEHYRDFFSPDATLTTVWQKEGDTIPKIHTTSINDFILQTKDGPDSQPIFEEKMLSHEIAIRNNLATAWVKYEAKFGAKENLMNWKGLDLFSFMKHDDEWKIISIVFESE